MRPVALTLLVAATLWLNSVYAAVTPTVALPGGPSIALAANDTRCSRCFFRNPSGGKAETCIDTVGIRSLHLNITALSDTYAALTTHNAKVIVSTDIGVRRAQICLRNAYAGDIAVRVALAAANTTIVKFVKKTHSAPAHYTSILFDSDLGAPVQIMNGFGATETGRDATSIAYHSDENDEVQRLTNSLLSYTSDVFVPQRSAALSNTPAYCARTSNATAVGGPTEGWYDWFDYTYCDLHMPLEDGHRTWTNLEPGAAAKVSRVATNLSFLKLSDPLSVIWECTAVGYRFKIDHFNRFAPVKVSEVTITTSGNSAHNAAFTFTEIKGPDPITDITQSGRDACDAPTAFEAFTRDVWCLPRDPSFASAISGMGDCLNGGTLTSSKVCACNDRYIGRVCELDSESIGYDTWIDYLANKTSADICSEVGDYICSGTGKCVPTQDGSDFNCVCDSGWFGDPVLDAAIYASAFLDECNKSTAPIDDSAIDVPESEVRAIGALRQCLFWGGGDITASGLYFAPTTAQYQVPVMHVWARDVIGVESVILAPNCTEFRGGPGCSPCAGFINGTEQPCLGSCFRHDDATPRCVCLASQSQMDPATGCKYPFCPTGPDGSLCQNLTTGSVCTRDPVVGNSTHGRKCACANGWTGDDCSVPLCVLAGDPLAGGNLSLCGGHGTCNAATGTCTCAADWTLVTSPDNHAGEVVGACTRKRCVNNCNNIVYVGDGGITRSICDYDATNPICHCYLKGRETTGDYDSMFYGDDCSIPFSQACGDGQCSSHGRCWSCEGQRQAYNTNQTITECVPPNYATPPTCGQCDSGWTGAHCETSMCNSGAGCQNGGRCKLAGSTWSCVCNKTTGEFGDACEYTNVTGAACIPSGGKGRVCNSNGVCRSNGTGPACSCGPDFTGVFCETSHLCTNCTGGTCSNVGTPTSPLFRCTCGEGSSVVTFLANSSESCDTLACPLYVGGVCQCGNNSVFDNTHRVCRKLCPFANDVECGVLTSDSVSRCLFVPLSSSDTPTCDCDAGYGIPGDTNVTVVSGPNGTCASTCGNRCYGVFGGGCRYPTSSFDCPPSGRGTGYCQFGPLDCNATLCANGGSAAWFSNGSFTCDCNDPYTRESDCHVSRCGSFANDTHGTCVCPAPGWALQTPPGTCVSKCVNGTAASPTNGTCICQTGFTGVYCEKPPFNPCAVSRSAYIGASCNISTCGPHGTPTPDGNACNCSTGFKQAPDDDNHPTCVTRCHPGVLPNATGANYTCACGAFTFSPLLGNCVIPEPQCSGHGTAHPTETTCTCDPGFSGLTCSVDDCNATLNTRSHYDAVNEECACKPPWTGYPECDTHTCGIGCPKPTQTTSHSGVVWESSSCDTDTYNFTSGGVVSVLTGPDSRWNCACASADQLPFGSICVAKCAVYGSVASLNNDTSPTNPCVCKSGCSGVLCDKCIQPSTSSPVLNTAGVAGVSVAAVALVAGGVAVWYFRYYPGRKGYAAP